jgi:hypothetical protein
VSALLWAAMVVALTSCVAWCFESVLTNWNTIWISRLGRHQVCSGVTLEVLCDVLSPDSRRWLVRRITILTKLQVCLIQSWSTFFGSL